MLKIIDIASDLSCSFSWVSCSANQVANQLAKQEAMPLVSFVKDFLSPWVYIVFLSNVHDFYPLWNSNVGELGSWLPLTNFCTSSKDCSSFLYSFSNEWRCIVSVSKKINKLLYHPPHSVNVYAFFFFIHQL